MNEEQIKIWEYLSENAVGYESRRSSTEIRDSLNLESGGSTNDYVRGLIRDMVINHSCLIGSLMYGSGYWIIQNQEELGLVYEELEKRARGVMVRANALKQNWENRNE